MAALKTLPGLLRFAQEYRRQFALAVEEHPEEYPWATARTVVHGNAGIVTLPRLTVDQVAGRMLAAVARGSFNKCGHAFKGTCKVLGIPHTYEAIDAFLRGEEV